MFPQRGDGKNPTRWMSHPILESASFLLQKSQERHHLKAKHSLYVLSHQRFSRMIISSFIAPVSTHM
jgi:hypothetical protein